MFIYKNSDTHSLEIEHSLLHSPFIIPHYGFHFSIHRIPGHFVNKPRERLFFTLLQPYRGFLCFAGGLLGGADPPELVRGLGGVAAAVRLRLAQTRRHTDAL